jgi:hypothetical protein
MNPQHSAMFVSCSLCHRRDRLPSAVAGAIRAGNVALEQYLCFDCGESEAGRALLAKWPEPDPSKTPSDEDQP